MVLAIDIGGTQYRLAAIDRNGGVRKIQRGKTDAAAGASWMIDRVIEAGRKFTESGTFQACGVGFGGPVAFDEQRVINSTHVPGWDSIPLAALIEDALGLPTVVDNDANLGALGELTFGAGRGCRHLVYYTISTGIGGGVIIDGEIYRGANGQAGEVGHVPILSDGPICACGNRGCLEALCSGPSIGRRAAEALALGGRSDGMGRILRETGKITAKDVIRLAKSGDRLALNLVEETAYHLGMGIATTVNTFAPNRVVIGGGVSRAGRILFDPLRRTTKDHVMPVHRRSVLIVRAARGDRSVLLGAAALAIGHT